MIPPVRASSESAVRRRPKRRPAVAHAAATRTTTHGRRGRVAEAVHGKAPVSVRPTRKPASHSPCRRQARFGPQPGSQSQSFSGSYRSNLPTSLTYIVLPNKGCSPWRPAADIGTVRHENSTVSTGFSRADAGTPDTSGSAVLYGNDGPISGQADSRASVPYKEKRTLPGTRADVSGFVCVAALDAPRGRAYLRARVREY